MIVANRFARLRRVLLRWTCWLAALVVLVYLCDYLMDMRLRQQRVPDCRWRTVTSPEKSDYSARYCILTKETVLLRVYDAAGGRLLAERAFWHPDWPHFFWRPHELGYDAYPNGGAVPLPPTLLDRLRAKLP